MLTKDEQNALDKVLEVYSLLRRTAGVHDSDTAAKLTQAWAMFAKQVEKNN